MFKTQDELKAFILWAKSQRIERVKIDNVEIQFSNLAFFEENPSSLDQAILPKMDSSTDNDGSPASGQEKEDDLLYWSAN